MRENRFIDRFELRKIHLRSEVAKIQKIIHDAKGALPYTKIRELFQNDEELWLTYCFNEQQPVYEIFTEEYIAKLGKYIEMRIRSLTDPQSNPLENCILEIGAGNGNLTAFLRTFLEQTGVPVHLVSTDQHPPLSDHYVEEKSYKEALQDYKPLIVLSSWMPQGHDFAQAIRATDSVREYILIGEPEICGTSKTWKPDDPNFVATHLVDAERYQICRTDTISKGVEPSESQHSETWAYSRRPTTPVRRS